jgi:DNA ligase-1
LSHHLSVHPKGILDGELYCHRFKADFNKIISLIKKTKPGVDDLAESAMHIEYWIYDMVTCPNLPFEKRTALLKDAIDLQRKLHPKIRIRYVETTLCHNQDELDEAYGRYMGDGFEGQMIRTRDGLYENKRSKNLLKRKEMHDDDFILVDLQEGRGNLTGIAARAVLKTKEGVQFEAGMIGSHEYCAELLRRKDEVIGQMATVVFQNLTPDGKPRFGKLKSIRDYDSS